LGRSTSIALISLNVSEYSIGLFRNDFLGYGRRQTVNFASEKGQDFTAIVTIGEVSLDPKTPEG